MKIIWHFKEQELCEQEQKLIEDKIKEFHNESLVAFASNLEIHILNEEKK